MIREAVPADRAALRAIQAVALDHPSPALLDAGVEGPAIALVRQVDGAPLGYALAMVTDQAGYLAELAVVPDRRREGHGSTLLTAVVERATDRGADRVRLTARAEADGVRAFYRQHDFEAVETLPDFYDDGDAVAMVRPL